MIKNDKKIMRGFIVVLSFSCSLASAADRTICLPLNDEPCIVIPTLICLNPVAFKCYPFMFSLDKCSGSSNSSNDLSTKIYVPSKTKDV